MGFKVDTRGLDTFKRKLKDIQRSIEPSAFDEWANRIESTARLLCNDHQAKRIRLKTSPQGRDKTTINFEFADKEAIDCVINAIRRHYHSMPNMQQQFYDRIIKNLEARKRQMST